MNSKRKADLQRKLSLAPVPRPPAGLAERIKNDIPEYLRPDAERRRMTSSLSFNLRVAASLVVLLSAVIAAVYLLEPEDQMKQMAAANRQGPSQVFAERPLSAAKDEVQVEITQAAAEPRPTAQVAVLSTMDSEAPAAPASRLGDAPAERHEAAETEVAGRLATGLAGVVAESVAVTAAPPPAPAPVAVAAPVAAEPQPIAVTAEAPARPDMARQRTSSLVTEAYAADLNFGPRSSVFGISVDESVFNRIRETLESNHRPSAEAVNVEAIVNYFAGSAAKPPKSGVRLEVEGSPSPLGGIGQHGFVRFSIDTPSGEGLPVASDAKLAVTFNDRIVASATPVGEEPGTAEAALLRNLSLTGLYEVELKPNRRPSDRVATVRLTYKNVADGKPKTIERNVYARDFTRAWTRASRRHRLASLGAVWGQSLKVSAPAPEVVRRAEELATQEPNNERAQELATAATASSKLTNGF
ncbi:MAG TPA: von Willebrand factor type A domain-containing protein [Thermoanaerobaculia bacterium]|nr:von Willebrand factor type A domain-containing protein [Thermoanaerobaculia bacterium]